MRPFPGVMLFPFIAFFLAPLSFAQAEDAKAVLARAMPVAGPGAVVSGPLSVYEIERESLQEMAACRECPQLPFGFTNEKWEGFKAEQQEGDVIFYFHTNDESWAALCGREGYALVRGAEVVRVFVTKMN